MEMREWGTLVKESIRDHSLVSGESEDIYLKVKI